MFNSYQKLLLPNNLRVLTIPMDSLPSVTVLIMIGAGSRYETKKINGISHFLEHMAFKGTKKRPTALAISEIIDGIGGEFNAFTSKDHTGYYIKAQVKHLELLFDVLSDMLLHSLLDAKELDKERGVIIEEIHMYEDMPARRVSELYEQLLYGDHPLGWDIAGQVANIKSISRENMVNYMKARYVPSNALVVVTGGIEEMIQSTNPSAQGPIIHLAEKWLGDWKNGDYSQSLNWSAKQSKPQTLIHYKKTEQTHLCVGTRAYALGSPKRYALSILTSILGGGMSSRLFIEVREKRGLAYYVRSGSEQYSDAGHFVTQAGVDTNRITDALQVILEEYALLRDKKKPIDQNEFQRAKEYLKGRLALELEDSRVVAGLYATQEILEGKIRTPQEIMDHIDNVTMEEVYQVARELFTQNMLNLAVIGPYKDKTRFERVLMI